MSVVVKADQGVITRTFQRLSTGVKMLIFLALALFPLGLVAVLASLDAAREGRAERALLSRIEAVRSADDLENLIARNAIALTFAAEWAVAGGGNGAQGCALLERTQRDRPDVLLGRYALYDARGRVSCASPGFAPARPVRPLAVGDTRIWLEDAALRYAVRTESSEATGSLDSAALRAVAAGAGERPIDLYLEANGRRLQLVDRFGDSRLQRPVASRARLGGSDVFAVVTTGAIPTSAVELVTIVLPLAMWIAAALLGWFIVDRLLLRPIMTMQRAVLAYRPGGQAFALPDIPTSASEIRDLGDAFVRVTAKVAEHEAELEAAIARQARLVREVHHRVKNNLQVVASLLNLHARGARSVDAADAYASIQRRVDALAVVHRNHFAELEDDRGVALRTLLSELTGNLRGTAPEGAAAMAITLDLDAVQVNQDVAVSVAFFVTEVVEHAMLCTPAEPVRVSLTRTDIPTVARLRLTSASLVEGAVCDNVDVRQFERITTGLSRQLRAVLEKDGVDGVYAIDITVQPPAQD